MELPEIVTPKLEGVGIVKRYGNVIALDAVDFAVYPAEVLVVIGDNGAGKSTLIKCLSGAELPDSGVIRLDGRATRFRNTNDARLMGINTVYQSVQAAAALDLDRRLFADHQVHPPGGIGWLVKQLEARGKRTPRPLDTNVVMLDEPTAALGQRERLQVRKLIDRLRTRGLPVVVVSHDVAFAHEIADRIHVQVDGRRAAVVSPSMFSRDDLREIASGALQVDPNQQALGPVR